MIIEFEDKYKRQVVISTTEIAALCENVAFTTDGTDNRKDGEWTVVMKGGQFYLEVSAEMKNLIQIAWEKSYV